MGWIFAKLREGDDTDKHAHPLPAGHYSWIEDERGRIWARIDGQEEDDDDEEDDDKDDDEDDDEEDDDEGKS